MFRKKIDVDVVKDILEAALAAYPDSTFIKSLSQQYAERGGLSKKQLEGLFNKSQKVKSIPVGKLATLEAMILKRPTRFKSAPPTAKPLYTKDERVGELISAILAKFPQHKRVLFFQSKYENNESLTPPEITELEKFSKLVHR
jgi:hypothetical protein